MGSYSAMGYERMERQKSLRLFYANCALDATDLPFFETKNDLNLAIKGIMASGRFCRMQDFQIEYFMQKISFNYQKKKKKNPFLTTAELLVILETKLQDSFKLYI